MKACPTRFRYKYVDGVRVIEDTESQRMGTNWHTLHEIYRKAINAKSGTPFEDAIATLNEAYAIIPDGFDATGWDIERTILATCFAGHVWRYGNDQVDTLATEVEFKLPLYHPKTRLPLLLDEVLRVGKIDRIVRYNGRISIADYKSTSKPIDADSDFWNHLRLDTQISMYVLAASELAASGQLASMGVLPTEHIEGAFYDVWHKPTIKPAKLTQAETAEFVKTGIYCSQQFQVKIECSQKTTNPPTTYTYVVVDGVPSEAEPGKKEGTFAIRETPGMFGARLLADIYERPDFYFARREIPRTDKDIKLFAGQLYSVYQAMKQARDSGHWIENEHSCNATFRCPYTPICFHGRGHEITEGKTPDGFRRIFADLTIEGNNQEI